MIIIEVILTILSNEFLAQMVEVVNLLVEVLCSILVDNNIFYIIKTKLGYNSNFT